MLVSMTHFRKLGELKGVLGVEKLEVAEDVLLDFFGLGLRIDLLEFEDDLRDGVLAVAAGNDFKAGAIEAKSALGHEKHTLVLAFTQAHAGGEARTRIGVNRHCGEFSGRKAPGGGQPGLT